MPTTANLRVALWALLGMALFLNYETWTHDYPAEVASSSVTGTAGAALDSTAPTAAAPGTGATASPAPGSATAVLPATTPPGLSASAPSAPSVRVVTDVLDTEVSLAGGELRQADLRDYPVAKNKPDEPVRLLNRDAPDSLFVVQSGLAGSTDEAAPTHLAVYSSPVTELRLAPGQNELQLPLHWSDHGVTVTKTLTFHRGQYQIGVDYQIRNDSSMAWSFAPYEQILRYNVPVERSYFRPDSYAFKGPAIYDGTKYRKLDIQKHATLDETVRNGWIAALQHDFVAAIVLPPDVPYRYDLQSQGNEFLLKALGPTESVAAGSSLSLHAATLFVGPKIQTALDATNPHLDLVADYGTLRIIATPLFWLLDHVHALIGNWGFAIIIVTILLKLLFYPLAETSGRSMAKMKALAPRMTALRETYKDDREKLNRAMMELYQREKVNPLAGCLPMVIQIPVFLAFYWVLRDSVELRQAPFMLWINDLSARDPWFVLPAIMAGAMFVQYKINPQVGDPAQQKIFMFMPLAMSVTFAFFPAGLVLYWVTNTVLSILQQWNINRRIEAATRARR
jgi:YidC/Oxa1 family membrane protein insertase